jgi:hypothetical protein
MIWFIVLNIVMNNGDVYTDVHYPNAPQYNNEQECNAAGRALVDAKQIEVGTNSGRTFYACMAITPEQIRAATGKSGSNS